MGIFDEDVIRKAVFDGAAPTGRAFSATDHADGVETTVKGVYVHGRLYITDVEERFQPRADDIEGQIIE